MQGIPPSTTKSPVSKYDSWFPDDQIDDLRQFLTIPRTRSQVIKFLGAVQCSDEKTQFSSEVWCEENHHVAFVESQLERLEANVVAISEICDHRKHVVGLVPDSDASRLASLVTKKLLDEASSHSMEFSDLLHVCNRELLSIVNDALAAAEKEANEKLQLQRGELETMRETSALRDQLAAANAHIADLERRLTAPPPLPLHASADQLPHQAASAAGLDSSSSSGVGGGSSSDIGGECDSCDYDDALEVC